MTLFLLLDPVDNIPVFHALLENHPRRIRVRVILRELLVPLAVPLIAGPSVIAMLLLLSNAEPQRMTEWTLALVLAWSLSALVLVASPLLLAILHPRGIRALIRLMGMILVMLGVQMLMDGITAFLRS